MKSLVICLLFGLLCICYAQPKIPTGGKNPSHWENIAKDYIKRKMKYKNNDRIAKNVILFVGDGMGPTTVTAARILRGQLNNMPGEETVLAFEDFPHVALSKTYNVDRQTSDSAGTATAFLSGVKTNYFIVGLDGTADVDDCPGSTGKQVTTMLDWAQEVGKATGVVTTARITHATPAAAYAHSANRYWEGDVNTVNVTGGCKDIARQLVEDNKNINVLFGGGRRYFLPNTVKDPETNAIGSNHRLDGKNLVEEWEDDKKGKGNYKYVWNKQQFEQIDHRYTDYVLGLSETCTKHFFIIAGRWKLVCLTGLFEPNHMQYELDRDTSGNGEPSLEQMTRKAIQILKKDDDGFFLMVEGARIDHGHHDSKATKALHEVLALEDAVMAALELTDEQETLIIVTADHSIPFDINGYAYRGTDIFGMVEPIADDEKTMDGKPYSVLSYANGPGYVSPRKDLTNEDLHDKDYIYPAGLPVPWTTHGGEDVAIYAQGPMAHLFYGVHEQNYIAHVMAYSACIGPYFGKCEREESTDQNASFGNRLTALPLAYTMIMWFMLKLF